ncbi:hypothetical protein [Nocardioides sp.]|uniref:hypothetical protein n=1 Tax=Nocardioides sp. TaxID=35761 RepID=UPI002D80E438|nr:hypothetical protein [Nocardioides sp.]
MGEDGEDEGGGFCGDDEGPGPGPGPGPEPGLAFTGGGGDELGGDDGGRAPGDPVEGLLGDPVAELDGRGCDDFSDLGLSGRSDGGAVIGAPAPSGAPGWVTTPWPAREITAQTSTAPTTTRTSQAEAART